MTPRSPLDRGGSGSGRGTPGTPDAEVHAPLVTGTYDERDPDFGRRLVERGGTEIPDDVPNASIRKGKDERPGSRDPAPP